MPQPAYPAILLAANWNGKKSLAAKILFPTKLGDELKAFETAYKTVHWEFAYNVPPDNSPLQIVGDQIMNYKTVFEGELGHLQATANIAKTHAMKIRGEWAKNPLAPKDLKTYLDNILKNFDPLLAKIEHDTKENFGRLLALQAKIAAANPKEANAALEAAGTKVIARDKNAPKTEGIKTKFKPQTPPPPKAKEKETDESESEEGNVPPPPPGTKPPRPTTPPPPKTGTSSGSSPQRPTTPPPSPPKRKESESTESEADEGKAPGSPGTKPRAGSGSTPPPPPGRPPTPPSPKTSTTSSGSSPKPPATPPPPTPKRKEKESRESESDEGNVPPPPPGTKPRTSGSTPPPPPGTRREKETIESESQESRHQ